MFLRILTLMFFWAGPAKPAAAPNASDLIKKYDEIMGADSFDGTMQMVSTREDGTTRTYRMRVLKSGHDRLRVFFQEPSAVRGQEMLRQGENQWVYMPNLKRAVRLASRESFQGGDFNNADVLRVNYQADFDPTLTPTSTDPTSFELSLKAKAPDAAYDRIKLWLRRSDLMPVRAQYFTSSGKMLREAEFSDVKTFAGGFRRPSRILMKNKLIEKRSSLMIVEAMDIRVHPPATKFVLDDLGR